MNNRGITYFRLNSPYEGDITKNCALDGYEVDNNFFTLEGRNIKSVCVIDDEIVIELVNGTKLGSGKVFTDFAKEVSIDFDQEKGILYFRQNGQITEIGGFVTDKNDGNGLASNSTLEGKGIKSDPLGVSPSYMTGHYKPVKEYKEPQTNDINGQCGCCNMVGSYDALPKPNEVKPGDRFLVLTENSDYGFLYNYDGVKRIACDLINTNSSWRIPTKDDWDNMLNAIEPCAEDRNHTSASSNTYLGRLAGKFLKSVNMWRSEGCLDSNTCISYPNENDCVNSCNCGRNIDCDPTYCGEYSSCPYRAPKRDNSGTDEYGFGAVPAGFADDGRHFAYFGERGFYWTATVTRSNASAYAKRFDYNKSSVYQDIVPTSMYLSLRLVKDYDGSNYLERESILGDNYPTVLIPSLTGGSKIWTSVNISLSNRCYSPLLPNDGQDLTKIRKYFIYEWTGKKWLCNELKEGEEVVILNAPNGSYATSYRVINGELVNLEQRTADEILEIIQPTIDGIEELVNQERERAESVEQELGNRINTVEAKADEAIQSVTGLTQTVNQVSETVSNIENELQEEREARIEKDAELNNRIDEISGGTEDLRHLIEEEAQTREAKDNELEGKLLNQEGTSFNQETGVLTLKSNDGTNDIDVQFSFNFGVI